MHSHFFSSNKTVLMSLFVLLTGASLTQAGTLGPLTYTVSTDSVTITDCDISVTSVEIPATIEDKPVTAIGNNAFYGCTLLTSITVPGNITTIGSYAFSSCQNLTSITLEEGITSIGSSAFNYCRALNTITIPASVTSIGGSAFRSCSALTSINVAAGNPAYISLDGILYNAGLTEVIQCPAGKTGSCTVPFGVTRINTSAFSYCSYLTDIVLPSSLTTIDPSAFYACSSLTGIILPSSLTTIGTAAFNQCNSLAGSITIPASVTSIGNDAFIFCSSLAAINVAAGNTMYSSVDGVLYSADLTHLIQCPAGKIGTYTVPSGVTTIESHAFYQCSFLTGISMPPTVTTIETYAFGYCLSLVDTAFPSSVTSIGDNAFVRCISLPHITIPSSVTSIGSVTFGYCDSLSTIDVEAGNTAYSSLDGVLFNADQTQIIQFPGGRAGSYTVPDGVTSINDSAFRSCEALTSIALPPSLSNIGSYAFYHCSALTGITLPASLSTIGSSAFRECKSLAGNVTIPIGVTSIGSSAFNECSSLSAFEVESGNPAYSSQDGVLYNAAMTQLLYYPGNKPGDFSFPATVTSLNSSAFSGASGLTGILLPRWVPSIGQFQACTNLASIEVESGHSQFSSVDGVVFNTNLTELIKFPAGKPGPYTIPASVTSIQAYGAFAYCAALEELVISPTVTDIGAFAFRWNTSITNLTIPATASLHHESLLECKALMNIHIDPAHPDYTSVDGVAFTKDLSELTAWPAGRSGSYTVPDGTISIGTDAFSESGLTDLTLPSSLTTIKHWAFSQCDSLTSFTIPATVKNMGNYVFNPCEQLQHVTFLGDAPTTFGTRVFGNTPLDVTVHHLSSNTGFTEPLWHSYLTTPWFMDNGFNPTSADLVQDVNGDGVSLLTAYALNLDPALDLSGSLPQAVITNNTMSIAYFAASPGITYVVETSTNLVDWTETDVTVSALDANLHSTATIDTTAPVSFLRLRVEQ